MRTQSGYNTVCRNLQIFKTLLSGKKHLILDKNEVLFYILLCDEAHKW